MMLAQKLEVSAGVKQQLEADAKRVPGVRLLAGRFMTINQAMAVPKGRDAGARYVRDFIEEMKATGFVAQALCPAQASTAQRWPVPTTRGRAQPRRGALACTSGEAGALDRRRAAGCPDRIIAPCGAMNSLLFNEIRRSRHARAPRARLMQLSPEISQTSGDQRHVRLSTIPSIPMSGSAPPASAENTDRRRSTMRVARATNPASGDAETLNARVIQSAVMRALFPRDADAQALSRRGRVLRCAGGDRQPGSVRRARGDGAGQEARSRRRTSRSASSRSPARRRSSWPIRSASTASRA